MEVNSVDRQLGMTLLSAGDRCYNSTTFISQKISTKEHTASKVQDGHSILLRNFCKDMRNYKILTPNIALQIFQAMKIRKLTNKSIIPVHEGKGRSKICIYLQAWPSELVYVCVCVFSAKLHRFRLRSTVSSVVCFLLGNSPASEVYMPTFRNTLSVPFS